MRPFLFFLFSRFFVTPILVTPILFVSIPKKATALSQPSKLNIGISQEFENFNPLIMTMSATTYMYRLTGRTLVTLDKNGKKVTQLAKAIPSFKKKTARKTHKGQKIRAIWEIIPEAKWNDGTPLTCRDFAFAKEVAQSNNISISEKETYTQVEKISWDNKNPKKCTFLYKKAKWDFDQIFSFYPLPQHIERPVFEKYKGEPGGYEKNSNYTKNPTQMGLYSGPYQLSELKLGSHVIFTPNPHFYGPKPKIKKLIVKLIPNTATLEANLRSKNIDLISHIGLTFDQALAFEKTVKRNKLPYQVHFKESLIYEHIDLNLDHPHLKNKKVRQALVYAINRKELSQSLFAGKQKAALHFIAPIDPWFTDNQKDIHIYPYNPKKAGQLLEEAGWKLKTKNGYRYNPKGEKLQFTIMSTAGNKVRELVQVYLKEQWKKAGVDLKIKNEPARVFFGETVRKRKVGAMAMYAWLSSPEQSPRANLHSQSIPSKANSWSGQNFPGWNSPQVDLLIEKLETEWNAKKRKKLVAQILKIYTEEVPVIPLYYRSNVSVTPKNLIGYHLPPHQFPPTNEVEFWELN